MILLRWGCSGWMCRLWSVCRKIISFCLKRQIGKRYCLVARAVCTFIGYCNPDLWFLSHPSSHKSTNWGFLTAVARSPQPSHTWGPENVKVENGDPARVSWGYIMPRIYRMIAHLIIPLLQFHQNLLILPSNTQRNDIHTLIWGLVPQVHPLIWLVIEK